MLEKDILNKLFTQKTLKSLISNENIGFLEFGIDEVNLNTEINTHQDLFTEIYTYMNKNYRNEYFYKNTILNKLLLGVHRPTTAAAMSEITISNSKADFILINGEATVYEIKTGLDSFARIDSQISDYFKAFKKVAIVTDEKNEELVFEKIENDNVGIYLLTKRNTLKCLRKPKNYDKNLDISVMFEVLNKQEYENILLKLAGGLPDVSQMRYYRVCKSEFLKLNIELAYLCYVNELRNRNKTNIELFSRVPMELKSVVYFSKFNDIEYDKLQNILESKV